MPASDITRAYLEEKSIPNFCQTETVYRYHVDLPSSSRISGCEMVIRAAGKNAVMSVVLPIAIRPKEARGIVRTLANYNRERLDNDLEGVFELDYLHGRIQFTMEVRDVKDMDDLSGEIDYCLEQMQKASNTMMRLVCEESDAVYQEEQEKIDNERRAAERAERISNAKANPLLNKLLNFLGLVEAGDENEPLCIEAPAQDYTEKSAAAAAGEAAEKTEEKSEEKSEEKTEA